MTVYRPEFCHLSYGLIIWMKWKGMWTEVPMGYREYDLLLLGQERNVKSDQNGIDL